MDAINIYELGRLSFLKLQKMKDAGVLGDEINTGCSGASTEVARKALFFMALQRDIGIKFLPEEIEQAETVGDIIGLSLKHLPKT